METFYFSLMSAGWGFASAVCVVLLGLLSGMGGRGRPRGAFAFSLLGIVWGTQIAIHNVARLASSPDLATQLHLISLVCLLPLPFFLLELSASQASQRENLRMWRPMRLAAIGVALANVTILFLEPSLFFRGIRILPDRLLPDWGPLYAPLVVAPFFLALGIVLLSLTHAKRRAPTPRTAARTATLVGGLALYVAFTAGNNLVFFGLHALVDGAQGARSFLLIFVGLSAVALYAGVRAVRDARTARSPAERVRERLLALAILTPFAWGAIEGYLAFHPGLLPRLDTVGLWRLAGVAVIAYGFARWRFYDLPQRTARAATSAGGAAVSLAGGAAVYGVTTVAVQQPVAGAGAALLVIAFSLVPSVRFVHRLFDGKARAAAQDVESRVYGQRIETYRAALEAALARGTEDEDAPFLEALRERFEISAEEDRILRYYARQSVIIPRAGDTLQAFERLRLLGEGGNGRTWLARDRQRDRLVVLKQPLARWQEDPTVKETAVREARMAARVRHPAVVLIEDVLDDKGMPVIVMEYLEGGSLEDLLQARGALPWREAVGIVERVLQGVEAVHAAGVVHRDIKPANILFNAQGQPKLCDFGISLPATASRTLIDASGTGLAGTNAYLPPEARGVAFHGDRAIDVYACAVVLHECIYGAPPAPNAVLLSRPEVPPAVTGVLYRALAPRREDRYPTARAFAEALAKVK